LKANERDTLRLESTTKQKSEAEKEIEERQQIINSLRNEQRDSVKTEETLRGKIRELERNLEAEHEKAKILQESKDRYEAELSDARNQAATVQGKLSEGMTDTIRHE